MKSASAHMVTTPSGSLQSEGEEATPFHRQPGARLQCVECGATATPQWREGPKGPKTLCNACGVRWQRTRRARPDAGGRRTAQSSKAAAPRSGQAPAAKKQRVVAPARTHSALPSDSDAANLILSLSAAQPKPQPPKQQQGSTAKRPPSTHAAVLLQHAQRQHALRARQPTGPVAHAPPTTDALRRPTVTTSGPVQDQQGTDSVDAHEDLAAGAQTGPTDTGQEPGAWAGPSEPGLHAGAGLQAEPEAGVQGVGSVADELTDGECELVLSLARSAQEMRRAANDAEAALTAALQEQEEKYGAAEQARSHLRKTVCDFEEGMLAVLLYLHDSNNPTNNHGSNPSNPSGDTAEDTGAPSGAGGSGAATAAGPRAGEPEADPVGHSSGPVAPQEVAHVAT